MWLLRAITRIMSYLANHQEDRNELQDWIKGDSVPKVKRPGPWPDPPAQV